MNKLTPWLLMAGLGVGSMTPLAQACSALAGTEPTPLLERITLADQVFSGQVVDVQDGMAVIASGRCIIATAMLSPLAMARGTVRRRLRGCHSSITCRHQRSGKIRTVSGNHLQWQGVRDCTGPYRTAPGSGAVLADLCPRKDSAGLSYQDLVRSMRLSRSVMSLE